MIEFYTEDKMRFDRWDTNKIYIICMPYSKNPELSFQRSVDIVRVLRRDHHVAVFSPILHTHPYEMGLQSAGLTYGDDYYWWDFAIYRALQASAVMIFPPDWKTSKGCRMEWKWANNLGLLIIYVHEAI